MSVYLNGTKREAQLDYLENGEVIPLGRVVTVRDNSKIAVLHREVPNWLREELFHGLGLSKIINEREDARNS